MWDAGIEVNEDMMKTTANIESKLTNFFLKARNVERTQGSAASNGAGETDASDATLLEALNKTKAQVDEALCDSFNTPEVMQAISQLITEYNSVPKPPSPKVTIEIGKWITWLVRVFGLDPDNKLDSERIGWSGVDIPAAAEAYVYLASALRDSIRREVKSDAIDYAKIAELAEKTANTPSDKTSAPNDSAPFEQAMHNFSLGIKQLAEAKAPAKDLLAMCDALRDISLWDLSIYLEDAIDPSEPALVRPLDQSLIIARQEKESAAKAKAQAKAKRDAEEAEKKRQLAEKAKVDPKQMFRTEEYSEWDEDGVPTKEKGGEEVTKTKRKKLGKEWDKQKKLHEEWKKSNEN